MPESKRIFPMNSLFRLIARYTDTISKKRIRPSVQVITKFNSRTLIQGMVIIILVFIGMTPALGQHAEQNEKGSLPAYSVAGFLQQQFIADQTPGTPLRFAIHRARLGVTGHITDRLSVNFIAGTVEPPHNTPRLVNAFVDFDLHPLVQIRTGQFLLPFGLEGPEPIPLNPAIERTMAIRQLNPFTMFRDVGVRFSGGESLFQYAIALINGEGANQPAQLDINNVLGRLGFQPWKDLKLGISGHYGRYQPDAATGGSAVRTRTGIDMSYQLEPFFFRGEYITRKVELSSDDTRTSAGAYLLGGYELSSHWKMIARYEYYIPERDLDSNYLTVLTLGLSYYFIDNTRLSVNYGIRNDHTESQTDDLLQVQMQVVL